MEVILLQKIANLGDIGDRVKVKPGFGRNYLLPGGKATLATYSINHQNWMPGPELPYVVAIVEIAEQPSVRLTTNLVNCPHDEIRIGMPVRVTFEHHEDPDGDVYLPLFEPDPQGGAA